MMRKRVMMMMTEIIGRDVDSPEVVICAELLSAQFTVDYRDLLKRWRELL